MITAKIPSQVKFTQKDDKARLEIPANIEIKEPIVIKLSSGNSANLEVNIGSNAKATILENFESDVSILDYQIKVNAAADSQLRVITLQNLSDRTEYSETRESFADSGSTVHFVNCQLGAGKVSTRIVQNGIGQSPTLNTDFISSAKNDQNIVCTVKNHFQKKNGGGEINAKGVARDKSNLEINGIIAIDRSAGGTNTQMNEHALLLSPDATVKATPALEIDTNDVKASHGASVTNLSDDVLFYAQSRGITDEDARMMMAKGFLLDRLSVIDDLPEIKDRIERLI